MNNATMKTAVIYKLNKQGVHIEPPIKCMFNPTEYKISKSNSWTPGKGKGLNLPSVDFGNGGAEMLTMQLFFDTYSIDKDGKPYTDEDGKPFDVREVYTNKILNLMLVDDKLTDDKNKKGRPPYVRFVWGKTWVFTAVITQINQQFTLFLGDGTPVRATLDVTFQQVQRDSKGEATREYPPTNPTSGGTGGERVWTVREGDSLALIAYQEYGDATRWRPIAAQNRLSEVRQLRPGMVLEIPNA
jgi:hypothetical protein